ncbi:MAG: DUF3175 domain-containing protein [Acidobacteria bacterium]|nr:DUF3175 domain-containing protein [Acidobacteriota bacterium]
MCLHCHLVVEMFHEAGADPRSGAWECPKCAHKYPFTHWSRRVTEQSNALDLDPGVFSRDDPRSIARSLKRSADRSRRRKSNPFRSAMSMLNFYINRAGKNLSKTRRARLEAAKDELRRLYQRERRAA